MIPFDPSGHDVDARVEPRARRAARAAPAGRPLVIGHRRHGDDGRRSWGCSRCSTACPRRRPCSATCRRRSTTRRASSARRRARRPSRSPSSSGGCARSRELAPYAELPGAGAAGGLGAALASLGAELVPGAAAVARARRLRPAARTALVVTGEGRVDATTAEGKAPAEVARRCARGRAAASSSAASSRSSFRAPRRSRSPATRRAPRAISFELGLRLGTRLLDAAG